MTSVDDATALSGAPGASLRPMMRNDLDMAEADDGRTIVTVPSTGAQVRLQPMALRLLLACDGTRDLGELATALGGCVDPGLETAVAEFQRLALLSGETSSQRPPVNAPGGESRWRHRGRRQHRHRQGGATSRPGRFRYRPPGTLEFAVLDAESWGRRLIPLASATMSVPAQLALWCVSVVGIVLWVGTPGFKNDLSEPVGAAAAGLGALLLVLATVVHELAHGGALAARGGRVSRLGVMLLYGSPAMYCDVSAAWRLRPAKRVLIALAGVRVNLFVAGACGLLAFLTSSGGLGHETAVVAAGGNLLMAVINLCPLVKFDGYVALIGWLDAPHLRRDSMRQAGAATRYLIFGSRRPAVPAGRLLYGLAAAVCGPALVAYAVLGYQSVALAVLGAIGSWIVLAAYCVAAYVLARRILRSAATAVADGAKPARVSFVLGGLVATAVGVLLTVHVPVKLPAVYFSDAGNSYLVLPDSVTADDLSAVSSVDLHRNGVFLRPRVGTAQLCGAPERHDVRVGVGSNVRVPTSQTTPERVVRLCAPAPDGAPEGLAQVVRRPAPVVAWLNALLIAPVLAQL